MGEETTGNGISAAEIEAKLPKIKYTKLFINGEFVDAISGKTFETIDPRNEEVIAHVAQGTRMTWTWLSRLLEMPSTMVPGLACQAPSVAG
ncbi:unnamed protein product [Rhodiola kirilowii]